MVQEQYPKIIIIILNWNDWKDVCSCIESIRLSSYSNYDICVVDNLSSDGSVNHLRKWDKNLQILNAGGNLGWSGGNNVGLRFARDHDYDLYFLVNPDITFTNNTILNLVEAYKICPNAAAFGCIVFSKSRPNWVECGGSYIDKKSGLPSYISCENSEYSYSCLIKDVPVVKGCAMMITKLGLSQIGLLEEDYFLNFDETDWCFRAGKMHMRIFMVTNSIVYHKGAVSFDGTDSPLYRYFISRNRLMFAHKQKFDFRRKFIALRSSFWELKRAVKHKNISMISKMILILVIVVSIVDYYRGKVGDCPKLIRKLSSIYIKINPKC
jgi:GT2 family glycosyltransferase